MQWFKMSTNIQLTEPFSSIIKDGKRDEVLFLLCVLSSYNLIKIKRNDEWIVAINHAEWAAFMGVRKCRIRAFLAFWVNRKCWEWVENCNLGNPKMSLLRLTTLQMSEIIDFSQPLYENREKRKEKKEKRDFGACAPNFFHQENSKENSKKSKDDDDFYAAMIKEVTSDDYLNKW